MAALTTVDAVMTDGTSATHDTPLHELDPGDLDRVAKEFGLGEVTDALFLADGLMNRNWRIKTTTGTYALKLLRDVPVEIADRNARALTSLRSAGLPVCVPVSTRDGDPVLPIESRNYLVSPWAQGTHVEGTDLPLSEVTGFGALVATIHEALNDPAHGALPPATTRPRTKVTTPANAIAKADRLLAAITTIAEPDDFDQLARDLLEERKILIDKHVGSSPPVGDAPGPFGWTHGDLQYRNVLHSECTVSAVLDWDRVAVKPFAEEIVRTAQVQFGGEHGHLDLERVAAFISGYRSVKPMRQADLADAVDRLWWKRMTDYWILEFHYDRADHGPDPLMAPSEQLLAWWAERRDEVHRAFSTP